MLHDEATQCRWPTRSLCIGENPGTNFLRRGAIRPVQPSSHVHQPCQSAPESWDAPYGLPPFTQTRPEHYAPAFEAAFDAHRAELAAIAANPQPYVCQHRGRV